VLLVKIGNRFVTFGRFGELFTRQCVWVQGQFLTETFAIRFNRIIYLPYCLFTKHSDYEGPG